MSKEIQVSSENLQTTNGNNINNLLSGKVGLLSPEQEASILSRLNGIESKELGDEIKGAVYWDRPRKGDSLRGIVAGFDMFMYKNEETGQPRPTLTAFMYVKEGSKIVTYIMSQTVAAEKLLKAGQGTSVEIVCTGTKGNTILFDVFELQD